MSITDTVNCSISGTDGSRINASSIEQGSTHLSIDTTIPASTTNQLVAASWTVANTQSIFILASQNCTLKTNSSSAPANTINLKAGIAYIFRASAGYNSNLFTTDVTAWYVTTTAATRLQALILTT